MGARSPRCGFVPPTFVRMAGGRQRRCRSRIGVGAPRSACPFRSATAGESDCTAPGSRSQRSGRLRVSASSCATIARRVTRWPARSRSGDTRSISASVCCARCRSPRLARKARYAFNSVTDRRSGLTEPEVNTASRPHRRQESPTVPGQAALRGTESAKALGLTIPPAVLARADEVIQ